MSSGIRVLSLFDGMGGGRIALKELGIPVDTYYASEVDKFAIRQTKMNFPDVVHLGDVRGIEGASLGHIDLILAGTPCTNLSFVGNRAGLSTVEGEEKMVSNIWNHVMMARLIVLRLLPKTIFCLVVAFVYSLRPNMLACRLFLIGIHGKEQAILR